MFKEKGEISTINKILIAILEIICVFSIAMILLLQLNKKSVETHVKETQGMFQNYAITEENTWDISKNSDGSVIATLSEDGTLTISGTGDMKDWDRYDTTTDWHNSSIRKKVKNVIINKGITSIGKYSFYECSDIISIKMSKEVISIGDGAFMKCNRLVSLIIPEGVKSLGSEAFYNCYSIRSINIPQKLTNVGNDAFYGCYDLEKISVDKNNIKYMDDNGVLYTKNKTKIVKYPAGKNDLQYTILEGVVYIGEGAFNGCRCLEKIEIPLSVMQIERRAFMECRRLMSIEIPNRVVDIENSTFYGCSNLAKIDIPEGVKNIGESAFSSCYSLTEINIPKSVLTIGANAFRYCTNLININISEGITSIESGAFDNCSNLTSIKIPNSVTCLGAYVFEGCERLINIDISNNLTTIGDRAFGKCISLNSINIPEKVTSIGKHVFLECENLTEINVDENNKKYCDDNGVLYTKDKTKIIVYPKGRNDDTYTILSSTTSIGENAFYKCENLRNIQIPSSVTTIETFAFSGCKMINFIDEGKEIELPNILQRLQNEEDILYSSKELSLTNCTIEGSKIIMSENEAFAKVEVQDGFLKGLTYIVLVPKWDISANDNGRVTAILSDDGTLTISGTGDMKNWKSSDTTDWHMNEIKKKIKNIIIYNGVTNIGEDAFYECDRLINIEMPTSIKDIGRGAFMYCKNLINVKIPEGVTKIEYCAFAQCANLRNIEMSNSVTNIGSQAFMCCFNITSIEIPSSVKSIEGSVFRYCKSLRSIKVDINNLNYTDIDGVLYTKDRTEIIRYPEGKKADTYAIANSVTSIGEYAFYNCVNLVSIKIPEGVIDINTEAFSNCERLTSIEIPDTVINIGYRAFDGCSSLTSVIIPYSVTIIEEDVFDWCSSLTDIKVDRNNTKYSDENGVLYTKDKTEIIRYPEGRGNLGYTILDSVTTISEGAFYGCDLAIINIPRSVTKIEKEAFEDCNNITIFCQSSSTAETYAIENNINYQLIHLSSTEREIDELSLLIIGIQPNTTVEELNKTIQSDVTYEVRDSEGNVITNTEVIGTGYEIKLKSGRIYELIVYGDTNGDGQADLKDILAINKHRLNKAQLTDEYLLAGDVNEDEKSDLRDILRINKYRLGKISEL